MKKIVAIVGTTASSKSDLGIKLAQEFGGEIVSADSRQVFVGLDIGSGKVTKEEQKLAKHYLLDVVKPEKSFSVAEFQKLAYSAIDEILNKNKIPFLVGGTGLYTRSIIEGFNLSEVTPNFKLRARLEKLSREELILELVSLGESIEKIKFLSPAHLIRRIEKKKAGESLENANKPKYDVLVLGLCWPKEVLHERIKKRLDARIADGMIEEVRGLLKNGVSPDFLKTLGLEYRYITQYILGEISYEEFYETLFKEIRHFAKRQVTWFKKENNIVWLDVSKDYEKQAKKLVLEFLKK